MARGTITISSNEKEKNKKRRANQIQFVPNKVRQLNNSIPMQIENMSKQIKRIQNSQEIKYFHSSTAIFGDPNVLKLSGTALNQHTGTFPAQGVGAGDRIGNSIYVRWIELQVSCFCGTNAPTITNVCSLWRTVIYNSKQNLPQVMDINTTSSQAWNYANSRNYNLIKMENSKFDLNRRSWTIRYKLPINAKFKFNGPDGANYIETPRFPMIYLHGFGTTVANTMQEIRISSVLVYTDD